MSSVRRLFQIRGPAAPKLVSKAVVRTHMLSEEDRRDRRLPSEFGDEMDIISQVGRNLTAQCLAHQKGK